MSDHDPAALLEQPFEQIQILQDAEHGVWASIAIHSTRLGPAFGGIRRSAYPSPDAALADSLRLAKAMARKCALAGVPGGGGKVVVRDHPGLDRAAAYRLVGRYVEQMGGRFYTGPDVGTTAADLAEVAAETRFVAHASPRGGFGDPGDIARSTALGVLAGLRAALADLEPQQTVAGARVVVQGVGAVGGNLVAMLLAEGAQACIADVDGEAIERVRAAASADHGSAVPLTVIEVDRVLAQSADVFAPCALGGVVTPEVAARLDVRAVAGSANNVLAEPRAGEVLFERGIRFAPDPIITAGALIHGALFHLQGAAPPESAVLAIGDSVAEVLARARREGRPPECVADRVADERIARGQPAHRPPAQLNLEAETGR